MYYQSLHWEWKIVVICSIFLWFFWFLCTSFDGVDIHLNNSYYACFQTVTHLYFQSEVQTRALSRREIFTTDLVDVATPKLLWHFNGRNKIFDQLNEALQNLRVAKLFRKQKKYEKSKKILDHAYSLAPFETSILLEYGELQELTGNLLFAEHLYYIASLIEPDNYYALEHRWRTYPLVQEIDRKSLNHLDQKLNEVYGLPASNELKMIKRKQYLSYIYHSNAIEGNTLTYAQTKSILETRLAVGGKSLVEQNEVLGLDAAMRYVNSSLLNTEADIQIEDILEIHRRILGFVDIAEAGRWRTSQVYIGGYTPPKHEDVPNHMMEFVNWLATPTVKLLHPVERAALAHWYFVNIHPFHDGNGRTARLLMNLLLMRGGYPPAIVHVQDRPAYYDRIQRANEGDVRWFIRFIAKAVEYTLDELLLCKQDQPLRKSLNLHDRNDYSPLVIYLNGTDLF